MKDEVVEIEIPIKIKTEMQESSTVWPESTESTESNMPGPSAPSANEPKIMRWGGQHLRETQLLCEMLQMRIHTLQATAQYLSHGRSEYKLSLIQVCKLRRRVLSAISEHVPHAITILSQMSCLRISELGSDFYSSELWFELEQLLSPSSSREKVPLYSLRDRYTMLWRLVRLPLLPYQIIQIARLLIVCPLEGTINDRYLVKQALPGEDRILMCEDAMTGSTVVAKILSIDTGLDEYSFGVRVNALKSSLFVQMLDIGIYQPESRPIITRPKLGGGGVRRPPKKGDANSFSPVEAEPKLAIILESCQTDMYSRLSQPRVNIAPLSLWTTMRTLLQGLDRLHREVGILHGDIKLDNIMFNSRNEPCFIDFGLAYNIGSRAHKRSIYTIGYTPPEIVHCPKSQQVTTPEWDVFAWGITMIFYTVPEYFDFFERNTPRAYERGFLKVATALAHIKALYGSELSEVLTSAVDPNPANRATVPELISKVIVALKDLGYGTTSPLIHACSTPDFIAPVTGCTYCLNIGLRVLHLPRIQDTLIRTSSRSARNSCGDLLGMMSTPQSIIFAALVDFALSC